MEARGEDAPVMNGHSQRQRRDMFIENHAPKKSQAPEGRHEVFACCVGQRSRVTLQAGARVTLLGMKKWVVRLVVALVLLGVVGIGLAIYFLGAIVKKGVEKAGPNITKTAVTLDSATLSIFSGSGQMKGFSVANPEGYTAPSAVKVGTMAMSVQPGSVFSDKIIVHSIRVVGPEITLEGTLAGNNLSKLLANIRGTAEQDKQKPDTKGQPSTRKMQVDDFLITGGRVNLSTSMLGGQATTVSLPEIHLANLGQGPGGITASELSEKVFSAVLEETLKQVAQSSVGKKISELTKNMPGGGTQAVENVTGTLGNLFKKK